VSALFSATVGPVSAVLLCVLAVLCVGTDLVRGKIYNAVTYPAIFVGLVAQVALHGWPGLWSALGGFAVGFFPPFLLFALGGLAGGDVKFLAAVGTIGGAVAATEALVLGFFFGGILAMAKLAWHGELFRSLGRALRVIGGWLVPGLKRVPLVAPGQTPLTIRFGLSIGLGTLAMLWDLRTGALSGLVQ
jgi:prepilin peptidase CpaA